MQHWQLALSLLGCGVAFGAITLALPRQKQSKEQLVRDAPTAMADYKRAYDAKIERMLQLKRMRLAINRNKDDSSQPIRE